jgi:4'-phosphopantetheinyl transferase
MVVMAVRWLARGMADVAASEAWLSPAESERLEVLRFPKRRTELRLARWTAKHAIAAALDLDLEHATLASIEVRPAATGAPSPFVASRPAPLAVSLSDRADWAVCVVAPPDVGIGCDLELVEPRSELFVHDWFTPAEQRLVDTPSVANVRDLYANLIWSAKESALKVLETGLRRDTRSVEVDLTETDGDRRWSRFVVRSREGDEFPGWWRRYGSFILTIAADTNTDAPEGLEEPPRLAGATPSHSWMTST